MTTVKSVGKTGFLKEFFVDQPDSGKAAINEAWRAAGNEGTISDSLIHQVRTSLGLAGKGRSQARASAGAGKRSSSAPRSNARRTGPKTRGRRAAEPKARVARTGAAPSAEPRATRGSRTQALIALEGRIDDLLHDARTAGGLPEFEEALRKARRILARSHGD